MRDLLQDMLLSKIWLFYTHTNWCRNRQIDRFTKQGLQKWMLTWKLLETVNFEPPQDILCNYYTTKIKRMRSSKYHQKILKATKLKNEGSASFVRWIGKKALNTTFRFYHYRVKRAFRVDTISLRKDYNKKKEMDKTKEKAINYLLPKPI
jgi:hypothetical protein